MTGLYDCVVVGAGPAGLSAALLLGRCCRSTLVVDSGEPRNRCTAAVHGFLSRDNIAPLELLRIGREQLAPYTTVSIRQGEVTAVDPIDGEYEVRLASGERYRCRKLLIATGVVDELPELPGIGDLYGHSIHHCPYCDGWEHRDQPIAVYGRGTAGRGLTLELTVWSRDLVLCTDGPSGFDDEDRALFARLGIVLREERVLRVEGQGGQLEQIVFAEGAPLPRKALFFCTSHRQHSDLAGALGCDFNDKGAVLVGDYEATNVPGVYVAGDASVHAQLVAIAAAEGARAAFAINTALLKESLATVPA
ncbi:MAG TPA: NAD(P)/FAD-dependent oxidoreductase [Gemmatimonadales bacterium]|nr:NAD(P)/FAD-dependent oxidoreductase [Gemmatimonadales bacterium]